jgi:hypothetical protein
MFLIYGKYKIINFITMVKLSKAIFVGYCLWEYKV